MRDTIHAGVIYIKTRLKNQILNIKLKIATLLFQTLVFCRREKKKIDTLLLLLVIQNISDFAFFRKVVGHYFDFRGQIRFDEIKIVEQLSSKIVVVLTPYYNFAKKAIPLWGNYLIKLLMLMCAYFIKKAYPYFECLPTQLANQIRSAGKTILVLLNMQVILALNLFECLNKTFVDRSGLFAQILVVLKRGVRTYPERIAADLRPTSTSNKIILALLTTHVLLALNLFECLNKTFVDLMSLFAQILVVFISLLIAVAYFTIAERKVMGGIQRRKGPNVVGFIGLLQPLADGLKLFVKETVLPANSNIGLFLLAPAWAFILSLVAWSIIPLAEGILLSDLELGMVYLLAISSLSVYGVLFAGWSSNSKYSYLGALRSAAQMISYELTIGFTFLTITVCAGSLNLSEVVLVQKYVWYVIPLLPTFIIFCVAMLAETNRHPFDLPEAEAELVSGYNVEYSSMAFALFFLGEYANMLQMSVLLSIFFLGGWLPLFTSFNIAAGVVWLFLKAGLGASFFIVTRAALPRYRYDQLMSVGWKCFLPLSVGYLVCVIGLLIGFNWLPKSF
jgi:NADH-quinone oxidoreductase subunit H